MSEPCKHIKKCCQWITQENYENICEELVVEDWNRNDCWKYLDLHKPNQTDTKRPREWKKYLGAKKQ